MDFCRPLVPSPCALRLTPTLHVLFTSPRVHSAQADPIPPRSRKRYKPCPAARLKLGQSWKCQVSKTRQPRRRIQAKRQQLFFFLLSLFNSIHSSHDPPPTTLTPLAPLGGDFFQPAWPNWRLALHQASSVSYVTTSSEYTISIFHLFCACLCRPALALLIPRGGGWPSPVSLCPVSTHHHPPASHFAETKNRSDLNQSQRPRLLSIPISPTRHIPDVHRHRACQP